MGAPVLPGDFAERYGPRALVVGGSDGIGAACADLVAGAGLDVVLLARREEQLARTAAKLRSRHGARVRTLAQDLTAPDLARRVGDATAELEIGLLLCVTGSSLRFARFLDEPLADALALVQRNVAATVALAHVFGNRMRARGRGGMMFCTSMAGLAGCAYQAVYSASKAFDQMFAESLWHDLHPFGIDSLCLAIGATRTESMETLGLKLDASNSMTPEQVAFEGLSQLGRVPFFAAGAQNRAGLPFFQSPDRAAVIEALSAGSAALAGLEHVPRSVPGPRDLPDA